MYMTILLIDFLVHLVKPGAPSSDRAFRFRASTPYLPALCCAASFPSCAAQHARNCELMNEVGTLRKVSALVHLLNKVIFESTFENASHEVGKQA
jgi:hypothetical protein